MHDPVIFVKGVTKIYPNGIVANKDVAIEVNAGEITCVVGPNGAGKTTLIRQIIGLLRPTKGEIKVLGVDPFMSQSIIKREVGYVPQLPVMFPAHKPIEVLEYVASLARTRIDDVVNILERLGLNDVKDLLGYQLSLGLRKLVLMSIALIKNPRIMILDEPTSFMDIIRKKAVWDLISEFKCNNKAVLLVSHDLEEVRRLCERFYLMMNGQVVFHARSLPSLSEAELRIYPRNMDDSDLIKIMIRNGVIKYDSGTLIVNYDSLIKAAEDLEYIASNGVNEIKLILEYPSFESFMEAVFKKVNSR
ncbi:MAG: ABC transporter ATP-binding protein [Desulfurococcaceae archaeon]